MNFVAIVLAAAGMALRNPFWPVGWDGEREVISPEPRFSPKAEGQQEREDDDVKTGLEATSSEEGMLQGNFENRLWIAAKKQLKFDGSTIRTTDAGKSRQAVTINGRVYCDGDLVSVNFNSMRFTWRVKSLTESRTMKLQRVRVRRIDDADEDKTKGPKK